MSEIGHNNPPLEPFDIVKNKIEAIQDEARNWLDGSQIENKQQAEAVAKLLDLSRKTNKEIDEARIAEKKPHDEAAKAVQTKYKPLLDKADLIVDCCKKVTTKWLVKLENEQREIERLARIEAEKQAAIAREAMLAASNGSLEAKEDAEFLLEQSKIAENDAQRAAKAKASLSTNGRAVSLRTSYEPVLSDFRQAMLHYMPIRRAEFEALITQFAKDDVRKGAREIQGFAIIEHKTAV